MIVRKVLKLYGRRIVSSFEEKLHECNMFMLMLLHINMIHNEIYRILSAKHLFEYNNTSKADVAPEALSGIGLDGVG